jgi:isoquinoline 1-oxidoreductase beta subunit
MRLNVNGADVDVDDRHEATPLLWVLRDVLGMPGTKFGCGAGYCAACTVLIDGRNEKSCQTAAGRAVGKQVTTVEGASGPIVDAVRDAWHRTNVVQCGYCQPGQTLAAVALLEKEHAPDDTTITRWMNANLCRCGTYPRIREAVHLAAATLAADERPEPLRAPEEPEMAPLTDADWADPVRPYLRFRDDGTIVVYCSQIEMGQGIHTGLATIVAEELDADFGAVRVVNAANGRRADKDVYGNPSFGGLYQITGNSNSTGGFWGTYRVIAAKARARFVAAAAAQWGVAPDEVRVEAGVVRGTAGQQATFAELAPVAEQLPVPEGVTPKARGAYTLIGREGRLRIDAPAKILGTTQFTIDVALPGLLTAVVLHPPRFGATAASVDDRTALEVAGVVAVVPIAEGIAVVGETLDDAHRGLNALAVTWDDTNAERRSTEQLLAEHHRLLESGTDAVTVVDKGGAEEALATAPYVVDATYELPYLAHAPMEPFNAVCRKREDGIVEVWAPTESPEYTVMAASSAAGIDPSQVYVHVTFAGGSFGMHSTSKQDPTTEAVQVAKALGWRFPIKLQSLREEEFKGGHFRPMAVHHVRAAADTHGRLTAMYHHIVAEPTSPNLPYVGDIMFKDRVDFFTTTGAVDPPYGYPAFKLASTNFYDARIPTMVWRSVGNSHTEFARESAIDELAIAAGRDPVHLRKDLLADDPRTLRVLELATKAAGWGSPLPEGHARGVACSSFLSPSAQIVEITLDARNRVVVERVVFALDPGIAINPDLIRAQVEGGVLFGLSAAAWGEVVLGEGGDIITQNFDRYPVVRMQSVPPIEVHIVESGERPSGVGEIAVPTTAPALANAIAALTRTRIRRLPLSKSIPVY